MNNIRNTITLFKILVFAMTMIILLILYTKVEIFLKPFAKENHLKNKKSYEENEENDTNRIENDPNWENFKEEQGGTGEINPVLAAPFDYAMPGAYLGSREPAAINKHYCKYNYGLPYDLNYSLDDLSFSPEKGNNSSYRIIYNITEAYDFQNDPQVTFATHMTPNFAYFIVEHLRHWNGMISVAAFVPEQDVKLFLEQINQFCYCQPEMRRVSIHVVTHKDVPFSKKGVYFEKPQNCTPKDSSKLKIYSKSDDKLVYPINVLRNVARISALTKYVVVADVELIPSRGLARGFLKMIQQKGMTNKKEVFVLPPFEVNNTERIPENKEELLKLVNEKRAVYFHQFVCPHCHRIPDLEKWYKSGSGNDVKRLFTVKRQKPYNNWEPVFIGTNAEPLYGEDLSWEGLQDKMSQALEMCLQDYNYTILDNAFLCHWPGITMKKYSLEYWRADYVEKNKQSFDKIINRFAKSYKIIPGCEVKSVRMKFKKNP